MKDDAQEQRPIWSHYYNTKRQPMVTVCYIDSDCGTAIGLSICSISQPGGVRKKTGRRIALQRAKFARDWQEQTIRDRTTWVWPRSVIRRQEVMDVIFSTDIVLAPWDIFAVGDKVYKIIYVDYAGFRFQRVPFWKTSQKNASTPLSENEETVV